MIYIIKFGEDGRRQDTYVKEEKTKKEVEDLLAQGFVEVSETEYQLLLGNIDGNEYIRDPQTGELKPYVPPEPTEKEKREAKAREIREKRDSLLTATDFLFLNDNPKHLTEEELEEVSNWREELRALPQQDGFPFDVEFPTTPDCITKIVAVEE